MNHFDQTLANIRAARREGNLEKELYYLQSIEKGPCANFEQFASGSAFAKWQIKNKKKINEMAEQKGSE